MKRIISLLLLVLTMSFAAETPAYADTGSWWDYARNHTIVNQPTDSGKIAVRTEDGVEKWVQKAYKDEEHSVWEWTDIYDENGQEIWRQTRNAAGEEDWVKASEAPGYEELNAQLEQAYRIKAVFDDGPLPAYKIDALLLINDTIKASPEFFSALGTQLAARGKTLTVHFVWDEDGEFYHYGGFYNGGTYTVKYLAGGSFTLLHEIGHMLEFDLLDLSAYRERWKALNGAAFKYDNWSTYPEDIGKDYYVDDHFLGTAFVRDYSATSFSEDFADCLADYLLGNRTALDLAVSEPESALPKKMGLMREILTQSFSLDPSVLPPVSPSEVSEQAGEGAGR